MTMNIGYTDMTADLFHYGHVNFLREAKKKCDYLLVGIHNDESVKSYKRLPIMSMEERMKVVEACRYVDKVISNAPVHITKEYLDEHNVDKVITVDNRPPEQLKMMYEIPLELNILEYVKYTDTISTTDIIDRIKSR